MKVEKISENQIKFVLNQSDLTERGINIAELVTSSEKTHGLLREMMDTALAEFDFQSDGAPLMIEAMPLSAESVVIIVTKINSLEEFEDKLSLLPRTVKNEPASEPPVNIESENILIYKFSCFDDAAAACASLYTDFEFESGLYEKRGTYYLIIESSSEFFDFNAFESILSEYGERYISTELSQYHIYEHGEPVIKKSAVQKLKIYNN